jgi:serine phosphatase RsbU (regulator of sigma subunit)
MFSDGYADQFGGPEGKKYKYRRFRHLLLNIHQLPPDKQKVLIEENIEEWMGNSEQIDDILVIGIRISN